jgi:hypothetical protein
MASESAEGVRKRRSSPPADTPPSPPPASPLASKARALLHWDHLPPWRRDNSYIRSGYRPSTSSFLDSLCSVTYLHNESVNIWTHLLGAVAAAAAALLYLYGIIEPRYPSADASDVLVFACFFAGAVACLGMSATYHAVSNHSEHVARWGNKLDYSGIVCMIVGSYVPCLYYGLFCEVWLMAVYLYAVSFPCFSSLPFLHPVPFLTRWADFHPRHRLRGGHLAGALPQTRVPTLALRHVRRAGDLGRGARRARTPTVRLAGDGGAYEPDVGVAPGLLLHLWRLPVRDPLA